MGCLTDYEVPNYRDLYRQEDRDILVRKEAERTDVKLIENAENIQGIQLAKLKPANKKKWSFPNKKFTPLGLREKIKLTVTKAEKATFIDFKDNTYGINYSGFYIDVHDVETQNFLYRIKPIDGGKKLSLSSLKDGTFLYKGDNKGYIISILEKKAYQIHYEIDKIEKFIQLCDERILSISNAGDCIFEKDSKGKFQKKLEKKIYVDKIIQIHDNFLLGRNSNYICFINANTLEITDTIDYDVWNEYASDIGMLSEYLCVIKNKDTKRKYALIDLINKEIINYTSESEQETIEYEKNNPDVFPSRTDIMVKALPLPDGSIFCTSYLGDWSFSSNRIIYWDSKNEEIKSRSLLNETDQSGRPLDTNILTIFENGYVIAGLVYGNNMYPLKYYLLK